MKARFAILAVLALVVAQAALAVPRTTAMFNAHGVKLGWVEAGEYPNAPARLQIYWHDNYDAGTVDTNPRGTFLVVQDHHGHALGLARRERPGRWVIYESESPTYESGPSRHRIGRALRRGPNRWDVYEGRQFVGFTGAGPYGPQAAAAMLLVQSD
jgi:hypothetical protein